MTIIDNLIFANLHRPLTGNVPIQSEYIHSEFADYIANPGFTIDIDPATGESGYSNENRMFFASFGNHEIIERSLRQHWYSISNLTSPYHLIYSYLIENTRIIQIFEIAIEKYLQDEEFGIADGQTFQWIMNSKNLFFHNHSSNKNSARPTSDSSRRNAYYRMFGLELPFGDNNNSPVSYHKAKVFNQTFVVLFESLLSAIWTAYTRAQSSGSFDQADVDRIKDESQKLGAILRARRGDEKIYTRQNLAHEEFISVFMLNWFTFVLSYDSPVVSFFKCEGDTFGERLQKLGAKVGLPAHAQAQSLFDLAIPCQAFLNSIEKNDVLINDAFLQNFLTVINNWEKATGHRIKNPEPIL